MPAAKPPKTRATASPQKKVRINVLLPQNLLAAARLLANRRGSSYSDVVRTALHRYVQEELRKEQETTKPSPGAKPDA